MATSGRACIDAQGPLAVGTTLGRQESTRVACGHCGYFPGKREWGILAKMKPDVIREMRAGTMARGE